MGNFVVTDPEILDLVDLAGRMESLEDHARRNRPLYRHLKALTGFLPSNARARQRLWHIEHKTDETPKCQVCCDRDVSWVMIHNCYNRFCSSKCAHASSEVRDKIKATNLEKYGVEWNLTSPSSINKRNKSLIDRFGTDDRSDIAKHADVVNARRQTNLDRYGATHNWSAESTVRDKTHQTMIEKYGHGHAMQVQELRSKTQNTNLAKYGTQWSIASDQSRTKRAATCVDKFGTDNPRKADIVKTKIAETIRDRYGDKRQKIQEATRAIWMQRYGVDHPWKVSEIRKKCVDSRDQYCYLDRAVKDKLTDKDWLHEQHLTNNKTLTKIATELNVSASTVGWYMKRHELDVQTKPSSQYERDMVDSIRCVYDGEIRTGCRNTIPPYELDIYLPELQLAIEVNGVYYHSELGGRGSTYHLNKTQRCLERGIRLIHVLDSEIINTPEIVTSKIYAAVKQSIPVYARTLEVALLSPQMKRDFFDDNHIQGNAKSSVCYGLVDSTGSVMAAASFGRPRFDSSAEWELIRMASLINHTVVGGASKLFKHFVRTHNPSNVISYCDKRWGTGGMYVQLGFTNTHDSAPNYFYFKRNRSHELFARNQFQKHKLQSKLQTFDPNISEWENMKNNGYDRIWDCGNSVWMWSCPDTINV